MTPVAHHPMSLTAFLPLFLIIQRVGIKVHLMPSKVGPQTYEAIRRRPKLWPRIKSGGEKSGFYGGGGGVYSKITMHRCMCASWFRWKCSRCLKVVNRPYTGSGGREYVNMRGLDGRRGLDRSLLRCGPRLSWCEAGKMNAQYGCERDRLPLLALWVGPQLKDRMYGIL